VICVVELMHRNFSLPAILILLLCVACAGPAASSPTPTPAASDTPSPAPSPTTVPAGFYLRLYTTQALPPDTTFNQLPPLTIADHTVIDGNVAIIMIYPGPLLIRPNAREITDDGIAAIVEEARALGLLGDTTDFTPGEPMPGAPTAHVDIVVDGVTYELTGSGELPVDCALGRGCGAEPGTPEAFAAFWQELQDLDGLVGSELGGSMPYEPERLAVLLTEPLVDEELPQQPMEWPLETKFADFGVEFMGGRCATVSGADLELLLPAVEQANQLTIFVDADEVGTSLVARVVVPGEQSPCPDEG
jgi:hypothetical protein